MYPETTRRRVIVGAGAGALALAYPGTVSAATSFNNVPKAIWINLITIDGIDNVITYANGIGCKTLFYGIGANSASVIDGMKTGKPAASFQAMQAFQQAGGRIWLMGGDVGWLAQPGTVPAPVATMIQVINGNPGLFAGIHLDVEPWSLSANPTWPTSKVADCGHLYTLYGTVKTALPAGTKISAAMTAQAATILKPNTTTSYLQLYAARLHEIAMMFYWNTLADDDAKTRKSREILKARKNWWFGQNFKEGGDGSWWQANPNGTTNKRTMATVWDSYAKPKNAKGMAFYTYSYLPTQLPVGSG